MDRGERRAGLMSRATTAIKAHFLVGILVLVVGVGRSSLLPSPSLLRLDVDWFQVGIIHFASRSCQESLLARRLWQHFLESLWFHHYIIRGRSSVRCGF